MHCVFAKICLWTIFVELVCIHFCLFAYNLYFCWEGDMGVVVLIGIAIS